MAPPAAFLLKNMPNTNIVFSEEIFMVIDRSLDDVRECLLEAAERNGWLTINGYNGKKVSINPDKVLYLEEVL